jgi:putative flippase GtrA
LPLSTATTEGPTVTCPGLLLRRPSLDGALLAGARHRAHAGVAALRSRDDVVVQFVRFVLVGGTANLLYALVFLGALPVGEQPANLAGAIASSALANELHRRLTFHAGERVGWLAAQWAGGGLALAGWLASSVALGALAAAASSPTAAVQVALVISVTATAGLIRFVALRWVFRPRATQPA